VDGRYIKRRIGIADDRQNANNIDVFNYKQAHLKAIEFSDTTTRAGEQGFDPDYTVNQALDDYFAWFRINSKSIRTTELSIEAHIRPSFGHYPVAELKTAQIKRWLTRRAKAPIRRRGKEIPLDDDPDTLRRRKATANRVFSIFKAALNHAYHDGRVESDHAWRRVKPFRQVDVPRIRFLSVAEVKALIEACPPDVRDLVQAGMAAITPSVRAVFAKHDGLEYSDEYFSVLRDREIDPPNKALNTDP
jgi:hypothetical protein